jgi:hypothetical protein
MKRTIVLRLPRFLRVAVSGSAILMLALAPTVSGQSAHSRKKAKEKAVATAEPPVVHDGDGPAYHAAPPHGVLPKTLPPQEFSDPRVQAAYAMAAKVPKVLYQQPCYCRCDKAYGHHSLLDCFAGTHGAECGTCLKEGVFTYLETQKGKTPAEIRAEIKRGDWQSVNLNDYYTTARVY